MLILDVGCSWGRELRAFKCCAKGYGKRYPDPYLVCAVNADFLMTPFQRGLSTIQKRQAM